MVLLINTYFKLLQLLLRKERCLEQVIAFSGVLPASPSGLGIRENRLSGKEDTVGAQFDAIDTLFESAGPLAVNR